MSIPAHKKPFRIKHIIKRPRPKIIKVRVPDKDVADLHERLRAKLASMPMGMSFEQMDHIILERGRSVCKG